MRDQCLRFFKAGVAAADPRAIVRSNLTEDFIGRYDNIHLIAIGKAACLMAAAAYDLIPKHKLALPGLVVTGYEQVTALDGLEVLGAGHPLPDENGLNAGRKLAERLQNARASDRVLLLISGGASAMLPYPVDGVSLADKIATTQLLLASGATINEVNCVRKHLSRLKGGGMAQMAAPAHLHALILSDVLGDDLSAIASGPTVADPTTFLDAKTILANKGIWDKVPASVKDYLQKGVAGAQAETLKPGDPIFANVTHSLIGSNSLSLAAVRNAAQQHNYHTQVYSEALTGETRAVAIQWAAESKTLTERGLQRATALVAGGETTVIVKGRGKGGRNQEMALAFALAAERLDINCRWTFLSGGTDGRDGPTDAAGGIVDQDTLGKIRRAGIDPQAALDNNDSYPALKAADALVMTGSTGTNVADLQILLVHPFTESPQQEK